MVDLEALGECVGFGGWECLVERCDAVGVEVVHHQHDDLRVGVVAVSSSFTCPAQSMRVRWGRAWTLRHPARGSTHTKIEQVPCRTYSESSRRSCPGLAGIASRACASSWWGFSSMQTTGRFGSRIRASTDEASSIRAANCAFAFGGIVQHAFR